MSNLATSDSAPMPGEKSCLLQSECKLTEIKLTRSRCRRHLLHTLLASPSQRQCTARSESQHCWVVRIPLCAAMSNAKTLIVSLHCAGTYSVMQLPLQGYSGTKKWTSQRDKSHHHCGETEADEHYQRKVRVGDTKGDSVLHA